ncbi:AMP-dependent synthetase and ligase [Mycolicibacterium rhodesiae JS60]|nr:AMP-dependent synthetase and ligase [Mycolicibacterium rhodesiae JS60]
MSSVERIVGWLMAPRDDTGIHLATDDGGWHLANYRDLADQARRIARRLVDEGVRSGDVVAVLMPTSDLCLATLFGVLAAGATLTPIVPPMFQHPDQYTAHLHGILGASGCSAVVAASGFSGLVQGALPGLDWAPKLIELDRVPECAPIDELVEPAPSVLLQMTSGSTSAPRGASIGWHSLATNLNVMEELCGMADGQLGVSWLPLYHDMGLIGCVFQAMTRQRNLRLLRPDQFVRDPLRWLQAAATAQHTASPSFGLVYASRRLKPEDLGDIDLSGLRTLVIGAEPINPDHLRAFTELTAANGFSRAAFMPSYGLAEHTLFATSHRLGEAHRMVRVDRSTLRHGKPIRVLARASDCVTDEPGNDWVVSVGTAAPGHDMWIADESGARMPEGTLGEIVLSGPSVAQGYHGDDNSTTRFVDDELRTGDAGFLLDGHLHVLGRMGTSLKINGRSIFTEDLDVSIAAAMGLAPSRVVAVAVNDAGLAGVAVFIEQATIAPGMITAGIRSLQANVGEDALLWLINVPRGTLSRTSSGKPRRAHMWQQWRAGQFLGAELLTIGGAQRDPQQLERVRTLFEKTRELAVIPADATVHFEGSLAEGFGNEGSDIDFLLLVPGASKQAVMPTVLFVDGRRVEVRAQSHEQIRKRLVRVRRAIDTGSITGVTEDLLNRVQRFLRGIPLYAGPEYGQLLDIVTYSELTTLLRSWWRRRANGCLRHAAALTLLGDEHEAVSWAREGLAQNMKAFLAARGEGYIEIKWLPEQIARLRRDADQNVAALLDEYQILDATHASSGRDFVEQALALAVRLGGPKITLDPENVLLRRAPGVTTWPIGSAPHVVRDKNDVFMLSAECAQSWGDVVFGQSIAETKAAHQHIRLFVRHGLIGLAWRGAGLITPVAAMCTPGRPLTPLPSSRRPVVTIDGAVTDQDITRSPLSARAFAECAGALLVANMVLENAREDFDGAVKNGQWQVTSLCGRRIVIMAVRILASAWGITPLPSDPVLLHQLDVLVPEHPQLAITVRRLSDLSVSDHDEASAAQRELDALVAEVREVTCGAQFPSSFSSKDEWQKTIRYGYQWLRLGGYVGAYVDLDETRDLLVTGGAQPSERPAQ